MTGNELTTTTENRTATSLRSRLKNALFSARRKHTKIWVVFFAGCIPFSIELVIHLVGAEYSFIRGGLLSLLAYTIDHLVYKTYQYKDLERKLVEILSLMGPRPKSPGEIQVRIEKILGFISSAPVKDMWVFA